MTKTKHFTFCNDELIDDPLTQSYINDPRAESALKLIKIYNNETRSNGMAGICPSAHIRITPQSLKLAEKLKVDCNMHVFPAQFRNNEDKSSGGSTWNMIILKTPFDKMGMGTVGSDYTVKELVTCRGKFEVHPMDYGDWEIEPTKEDMVRLNTLHKKRMDARFEKNIKIMNARADANLAKMTPEQRRWITTGKII